MSNSIASRVDRGVEFLDAMRPGWRLALDLESLDLSDPELCVLGQAFDDETRPDGMMRWSWGRLAMFDYADTQLVSASEFGFDTDNSRGETYDELQREWMSRLRS